MGQRRVTVDVWLAEHPFPRFLDPVYQRANEFGQRHPEYEIAIRGYDFRELPAAVARAVRAGNPPHVAEFYATSTQLARDMRGAQGGPLFVPVERAIAGRPDILGEPVVIDDILPAVRDYYTFDGALASVPSAATTALLYTNRTLLDAAGGPDPPQTWAEVELASTAIARLAGGPPQAIAWPIHGWLFQEAVAGQGGLIADQANGRAGRATKVRLASAEMMAFVDWWSRLHRDGHYLYTGTRGDWHGTFDAFAAQRVAFMVGSSVIVEQATQVGRAAGFEVQVSRLPHNELGPSAGHVLSGQSLWLADGLDERTRDGALAFMQFLINPRNAADWHRRAGFVPVTGAAHAWLEQQGWFAAHPSRQVATDQLCATDRSPAALGAVLGDFAGIQDAMAAAMEDVLLTQCDPAVRFDRATIEAQRLLDEYNEDCRAGRTPRRQRVG